MPIARLILCPLALCGALLLGELGLAEAPAACAYEAVTTQAGLSQQAALASRLHRRLIQRLVHPLGLFEPLRLDLSSLPSTRARNLYGRLVGLDPAEGYAPEWQQPGAGQAHPLGRQHALGWLVEKYVGILLAARSEHEHFAATVVIGHPLRQLAAMKMAAKGSQAFDEFDESH